MDLTFPIHPNLDFIWIVCVSCITLTTCFVLLLWRSSSVFFSHLPFWHWSLKAKRRCRMSHSPRTLHGIMVTRMPALPKKVLTRLVWYHGELSFHDLDCTHKYTQTHSLFINKLFNNLNHIIVWSHILCLIVLINLHIWLGKIPYFCQNQRLYYI